MFNSHAFQTIILPVPYSKKPPMFDQIILALYKRQRTACRTQYVGSVCHQCLDLLGITHFKVLIVISSLLSWYGLFNMQHALDDTMMEELLIAAEVRVTMQIPASANQSPHDLHDPVGGPHEISIWHVLQATPWLSQSCLQASNENSRACRLKSYAYSKACRTSVTANRNNYKVQLIGLFFMVWSTVRCEKMFLQWWSEVFLRCSYQNGTFLLDGVDVKLNQHFQLFPIFLREHYFDWYSK